MSPTELEYYRERARSERHRAKLASGVANEIHEQLACLYEKLIELEEQELAVEANSRTRIVPLRAARTQ